LIRFLGLLSCCDSGGERLPDVISKPTVSVWALKPWWCQPWSIWLTGLGLIGFSWLFLHRWWLTAGVAVPVLTWMVYFLGVYPQLFRQAQAQQAGSPDVLSSDRSA
jgi:membrane protein YdbS with pleckstrin-like domain